jgi:hypothetical protein
MIHSSGIPCLAFSPSHGAPGGHSSGSCSRARQSAGHEHLYAGIAPGASKQGRWYEQHVAAEQSSVSFHAVHSAILLGPGMHTFASEDCAARGQCSARELIVGQQRLSRSAVEKQPSLERDEEPAHQREERRRGI